MSNSLRMKTRYRLQIPAFLQQCTDVVEHSTEFNFAAQTWYGFDQDYPSNIRP